MMARGNGALRFRVTSRLSIECLVQLLATIIITSIIIIHAPECDAVGYSYARFEGPVVGPEHQVAAPDGRYDYVAQPEYSFAYGVEDGESRLLQNRKETRHGDEVRGVYSVVDPDGTLRVVKYTADDVNGFQAEVIKDGVGTLHGHGNDANGGVTVDHQLEHETNTVDDDGKGHYQVHEDYDEGGGDGGGGEGEGEGEGEGGNDDHEEYEGSSEEGYEDAKQQQQQHEEEEEETTSDEEY